MKKAGRMLDFGSFDRHALNTHTHTQQTHRQNKRKRERNTHMRIILINKLILVDSTEKKIVDTQTQTNDDK